jgi:hypothetical protein
MTSLRRIPFGLFAALTILFVGVWAISAFGSFHFSLKPQTHTEYVVGALRGRMALGHSEKLLLFAHSFHGEWWGWPESKSDALGAFDYRYFDGPIAGYPHPRVTYTNIEIPLPLLAACSGFAAWLIYRRLRITLAAGMTALVVASILAALYAHPPRDEERAVHPEVRLLFRTPF